MRLDSDVNNADSLLDVKIYEHQRDPYKGVPFIRIMTPGNKENIIDTPVREHHKARFPRQWQYFLIQTGGEQVVGTLLEAWNKECPEELTDGQLAELQILKFRTVEQVATGSDMQMQKVGMGAAGMRERAKAYLARKNQSENASELSTLRAQMAKMEAMLNAKTAPVIQPMVIKRKPGRPKKESVNDDNASTHAASHR